MTAPLKEQTELKNGVSVVIGVHFLMPKLASEIEWKPLLRQAEVFVFFFFLLWKIREGIIKLRVGVFFFGSFLCVLLGFLPNFLINFYTWTWWIVGCIIYGVGFSRIKPSGLPLLSFKIAAHSWLDGK